MTVGILTKLTTGFNCDDAEEGSFVRADKKLRVSMQW